MKLDRKLKMSLVRSKKLKKLKRSDSISCCHSNQLLTSTQALETKKDEMLALKADLEQRTAELNEARGAEIEMRNNLEENQKILTENVKRLKYWQEKLSKVTIQNIR